MFKPWSGLKIDNQDSNCQCFCCLDFHHFGHQSSPESSESHSFSIFNRSTLITLILFSWSLGWKGFDQPVRFEADSSLWAELFTVKIGFNLKRFEMFFQGTIVFANFTSLKSATHSPNQAVVVMFKTELSQNQLDASTSFSRLLWASQDCLEIGVWRRRRRRRRRRVRRRWRRRRRWRGWRRLVAAASVSPCPLSFSLLLSFLKD